MALVLENITVLDITRIGPGPHCTMLLADFGAQVIKIEPPPTSTAKRLTASAFPRITGISAQKEEENAERQTAYNAINRNKKSLAIDLKSKEGCEIFYKLVKTADVIVEGFRPGVAKRLRIDYNTIKDINRKIVYCSISGYGQNGPYQNL
ncbi:MAG: CoA transferase, partial [Chloroflexota bacterium]|nr:CoA transferase [Chloroflexota bacterium]